MTSFSSPSSISLFKMELSKYSFSSQGYLAVCLLCPTNWVFEGQRYFLFVFVLAKLGMIELRVLAHARQGPLPLCHIPSPEVL